MESFVHRVPQLVRVDHGFGDELHVAAFHIDVDNRVAASFSRPSEEHREPHREDIGTVGILHRDGATSAAIVGHMRFMSRTVSNSTLGYLASFSTCHHTL
jgi:hypothetical protein